MGLNINTNIVGLQAGRNTRQTNRLLNNTLRQLSSGLRINRAADDAAGLAIAERFSSQVRQSRVEANNLQSGINAAQTAEGGLSVQQDATQRLRELSLQAANGTLSEGQRQALNAEAQQLVDQINDVSQDTQFNGQGLLNQDQTIDLGTEGGSALELQDASAGALGLDTIDLSTADGANAALGAIDTAQQQIANNRASLGAQTNRFESAINQRDIAGENAAAAESQIRDLDIARAALERSQNEVLLQSGISALAQGNISQQSALQLLGQ